MMTAIQFRQVTKRFRGVQALRDVNLNVSATCQRAGRSSVVRGMAVGNHIPANMPVANALSYNQVYEELSKR